MGKPNTAESYAFSPKRLRSAKQKAITLSSSAIRGTIVDCCSTKTEVRSNRENAKRELKRQSRKPAASDPAGPNSLTNGATVDGVEARAHSGASDPAGPTLTRSGATVVGVEAQKPVKTSKPHHPKAPAKDEGKEARRNSTSKCPQHKAEVRKCAIKPKYCAELNIAKEHTGKLFSVNKSFTEYEPSAFICELTRFGTKVRLSSVIDRDNYECLLKRHKVPYSIGAGTKKNVKKLVIKGLDSSVRPSDIQEDLEGLGFEVLRVVNMTSFRTKKPLPMFQAVLVDGPNVCEALNIKSLSYYKVKVEDYLPSKVPPQCSNCQMFYHTAGHCRATPRCRFCAGSHHTKSCNKTSKRKCCHCKEAHTANYKGCKVYKEITLQQIGKPKPRLGREPRTTSPGTQKTGAAKPNATDSGKKAISTKTKSGKKVAADSGKQANARSSDGSIPSKNTKTKKNVDQNSQTCVRSASNVYTQTDKPKGVDKKMQAQIDGKDCSCNINCPKATEDASCIMHSLAGVVKTAIKQQVTSFYVKVDLELDCSDNIKYYKCAQTVSPRSEKRRVRHKKSQTDVPEHDKNNCDNAYEALALRYESESCKCGGAIDCTWLQWHFNCVQSKRDNANLVFAPVSRRTQ